MAIHPLSQLTRDEIRTAAQLARRLHPSGAELVFKAITLQEPDKKQTQEYLEKEHAGQAPAGVSERRAFLNYYLKGGVMNLSKNAIEGHRRLDRLLHGPADYVEAEWVEREAMKAPSVHEELAKLGLPESAQIVCEPWVYGSDGIDDEKRLFQCFLFMRDPENPSELDSNHYALPLPVSPVFDVQEGRVVRVDWLPTGADHRTSDKSGYKVPPPNEYMPKYQKLREDLKPLHIVQPEGASFKVSEDGEGSHVLQWQKWYMRVGFNAREGMVLYDVRYDGRPLFYRISLSDMNIPYADPRSPYHRKAAFDLGDAGAGVTANDLRLGCDCLGSIYYLSSYIHSPDGDVAEKPNCVCIHEQDSGIGWKHTNYRTQKAAVVRNRELVLQSILTVSNYEYQLAFIFSQAGDISYEVRATGILSTQAIDLNTEVPWGTIVHPGVLAAHHQHIFSLRLDPMLDGPQNRLIYEEAKAMPRSADLNPHGTGYTTSETIVDFSGGYDLDIATNRTFKIQNGGSRNPVNGKPVSYKIMAPDFQKMLADKESFHYKRAEFADHNIYVTKYQDNELYAAGQYTNQSRGGTGVRSWADRKESVADDDIVVWVQFGINHIPRIEDFPVMPVEIMKVHLRPVNFFDRNPALDVPPSTQSVNKSCLLSSHPKTS